MKTKLTTENNPTKETKNITVEEIRKATARVTALLETMSFVEPLSQAERRSHRTVHLGPKTLRTINNRLVTAQANPNLLPPAFDLKRYERDTALASALSECLSAVDRMQSAVRETLLVVGRRAVVDSATVYGYLRVTATTADRLKRTVERLGRRTAQSTTVPTPTPTPAPAPTVTPTPIVSINANEPNDAPNGVAANQAG